MTLDIPGYKIVRTLGKGGMATVYLAVQEIFEREVALKVMARELANNPDFGQRFFREARIVSKLSHPNIVTVYDVGVHKGLYYLSMEYIDGQDLKLARKRLSLPEKIQVVQDIAQALDFAGEKGYVHRDIKPENIMLYAKDNRAVLMDFGIARASDAEIGVTQTGTAIGTPHYMSPEQAKGQAVDIRSDLYSLGVVFYLLLTGHVPYDGDSAVAIGIKHITHPLPKLPVEMRAAQAILDALMAKLPADRYQSPGHLVAALETLKKQPWSGPEFSALAGGGQEPTDQAAAEISAYAEVDKGQLTIVGPAAHPTTSVAQKYTNASDAPSLTLRNDTPVLAEKPSDIPWPWVVGVLVLAMGAGGALIYQQKFSQPERPFERLTQIEGAPAKPKVTGAVDDVRQLQEAVAQKRRALDADPTQLNSLVALYRQLEQLRPQDKTVVVALDELARQHVKKIAWYINAADFDAAADALNNMRTLFPEYIGDDLVVQEARFKRHEQIKTLLVAADNYRKRGALDAPEGANARQSYEAVLAIDPAIEPARLALAAMASPGRSPAPLPTTTVERLKLAAIYQQQGRLFAPADDSAQKLYQLVLTQEPGNDSARKGLQSVLIELDKRCKQWLNEGKYAQAREQMLAAVKANPNDKRILSMQQQLDNAIVERSRTLPQISELRVANSADSITPQAQPALLSPAKYLFVHFRLTARPIHPLQIMLYQGARSERLLKMPLSVNGESVTAKVEPAVGGFARGHYVMDIVSTGQIVASLQFDIE